MGHTEHLGKIYFTEHDDQNIGSCLNGVLGESGFAAINYILNDLNMKWRANDTAWNGMAWRRK